MSYLDRNKVIVIPDDTEEGDVNYAKTEFRRVFSFEGDANLTVILQKFDHEWNAYVDLEDDDALGDKDKIKAVVMSVFQEKPAETSNAERNTDKYSDVSLY